MGNKYAKKRINEEDLQFLTTHTQFNREEVVDWHKKFLVCVLFYSNSLVIQGIKQNKRMIPLVWVFLILVISGILAYAIYDIYMTCFEGF